MRLKNFLLAATLFASVPALRAQDATAAPKQSGTVKATAGNDLTLTTTAGQDYTVTVGAATKVLVVAPGSKDLKSATSGTIADVTPGDRVIVNGTAGDTGSTLKATRVILMKSEAIAQTHAADEAAWTRGGGGIVKSVDVSAGKVVVSSGMKALEVDTTPATIVRRYSGGSIKFEDAVKSSLAEIRPGDQLRVRGTKSPDGMTIAADEIVTGSFHNYSGLISAIDATSGAVTLKDLTTKKAVTVMVVANSDVRRVPPMVAQRLAAQMKGGAAGAPGAGAPGAGGAGAAGGGAGAGGPRGGGAGGSGGYQGGGGTGGGARTGRAGMDLSQMLSRLPTETLGGLKAGDAVMIVATTPVDAGKPTAVTLLVGVDAILTASPNGEMTLTPWGVGGGGGGEGGGEGGGQ